MQAAIAGAFDPVAALPASAGASDSVAMGQAAIAGPSDPATIVTTRFSRFSFLAFFGEVFALSLVSRLDMHARWREVALGIPVGTPLAHAIERRTVV